MYLRGKQESPEPDSTNNHVVDFDNIPEPVEEQNQFKPFLRYMNGINCV